MFPFGRYTLIVLATDNGSTKRTGTATITVNVDDLNDNDPVITGTYTASIPEDLLFGTEVFAIVATDADRDENARLQYSLTGGDNGDFQIDSISGRITTTQTLDRELTPSYAISFKVIDLGSPTRSATATASVTITDVNDNAPMFTRTFLFYIHEDIALGAEVGRVVATDADIGLNSLFEFTLQSVSGGPVEHFRVDNTSGTIYVNSTGIDREQHDYYMLKMRVTDKGTPPLYSDTNVVIHIQDVNDRYPYCSPLAYTVFVPENSAAGQSLLNITTNDKDVGVNSIVTHTIVANNDTGPFGIDTYSGEITLKISLDREAKPSYKFDVKVQDSGSPSLFGVCAVAVYVLDVNDNAPVFTRALYDSEIAYNDLSQVIKVEATDTDAGDNGTVWYSVSGGGAANFNIGTQSGDYVRSFICSIRIKGYKLQYRHQ